MRALGPLAQGNFRLLFSAQAISQLGSAVSPVALAFGILAATGSAVDLGIVLTAREAVMVVLLLFGGVWADRLPRQVIGAVSNSACTLAQAATGILFLTIPHGSGRWPCWRPPPAPRSPSGPRRRSA